MRVAKLNSTLARTARVTAMCLAIVFAARGALAQAPKMSLPLANAVDTYLRLDVTAGRVTVANTAVSHQLDFHSNSDTRQESLILSKIDGLTSVTYSHRAEGRELKMRATGAFVSKAPRFTIEITSAPVELDEQDGKVVAFRQTDGGSLCFAYRDADGLRVVEGGTIWHLISCEPELFERELLPLLLLLRHEWPLMDEATRIEQALFRTAVDWARYDFGEWSRWVADLGSERFVVRQAADERFRMLGPVAVPYLLDLDEDSLDAEQRHRVRQLLRALPQGVIGAPHETTAAWLAGDAWMWCLLLERAAGDERQLAIAHLGRLLREQVAIDPLADDATYQAAVARMRERLEPRRFRDDKSFQALLGTLRPVDAGS